MAKAKFGMIVTDMRNKLGGHVFSKNRSGAIVRTKVTPANPQSIAQMGARSRLAGFSSAWAGLSSDDREAWNNEVSNYQKTDVFGDLKKPSGKNLYTALNINLANIGGVALDVPPVKHEVPSPDVTGVVIDLSSTTITLTGLTEQTDYTVVILSTGSISAGITYTRGKFRQVATTDGATGYALTLWTAYVSKFGTPDSEMSIWFEYKLIDNNTGQAGIALKAKASIQA